MKKHTPTPWHVDVGNLDTTIESKYFTVASDLSNDDAEHIVRCVNAHDKLVAALREIKAGLSDDRAYRDVARAALALIDSD